MNRAPFVHMKPAGNGVSMATFGVIVAVLLIVAAAGFGLYLTKSPNGEAMASTTTDLMTVTTTESMSAPAVSSFSLAPATGQMVHDAWATVGFTASGEYTLTVVAQGLDATMGTGNVYMIEGAQSTGSMAVVPIGPNATASEFEVGSGGSGSYFVTFSQNPLSLYESIEIVYLPGMQMANATLVASASLTPMTP